MRSYTDIIAMTYAPLSSAKKKKTANAPSRDRKFPSAIRSNDEHD